MKKEYIVLKESFLQSVFSDICTFGFLTFCIWFSGDSRFWQFICFVMFFIHLASAFKRRTSTAPHFDSKEKLKQWLDKENKENK